MNEVKLDTPDSIKDHAEDYKDQSWQDYTLEELGMFVHLLVKRSGHRSNTDKAMKDLTDAQNYLAMMYAWVNYEIRRLKPDQKEVKYYICMQCGELTTSTRIDEDLALGGVSDCYCKYSTRVWNSNEKAFDYECDRVFIPYTEIPEVVFRELEKEDNTVLRLGMLRQIPKQDLEV